jgi:hypothetical protein
MLSHSIEIPCRNPHRHWLFKALLAPKPHQEHICDMDKFVWHFCVNYILLNSVTHIIAYPIPCCNLTINEEFDQSAFFWLWDAPMGYHQLTVALASQVNLAFQGPDAIKWTYTIAIPSCLLAQQTDLPHLSLSSTTSTADGVPWHSKRILSSMTTRRQKSSSTTSSVGQVTFHGIDLHRVPTLCVPGLTTFIVLAKESHLSKVLQICRDRRLF